MRERICSAKRGDSRACSAAADRKDREIKYIGEELSGVWNSTPRTSYRWRVTCNCSATRRACRASAGELVAEIARSRGKIAETELQILQLDQDFRTEVLKDLRETEAKVAELQERANAADDELKHTEIRVPQAGTVYQLQVHTIGGVIGKGETLMQIVPRADALIVEAKVAPQDIDQVAVGAPVRVRLEAGNRRTTPDLGGKVTLVSPDLTRDPVTTPAGAQSHNITWRACSLTNRYQVHRRSEIGAGHAGRGLYPHPRSHAPRIICSNRCTSRSRAPFGNGRWFGRRSRRTGQANVRDRGKNSSSHRDG